MHFFNLIRLSYLIPTTLALTFPRTPRDIVDPTVFISGVCDRMYRTCVQGCTTAPHDCTTYSTFICWKSICTRREDDGPGGTMCADNWDACSDSTKAPLLQWID
ncbi:hypothetical protein Vi05172_g8573 [Venturia inaequalis]|nr:hypothetical protein Vi05172_g8573 [Venturia inaequalis]